MKEQCEKLVEQIDYMTAELDIHKMEISRQEDVINRQQREINDLKVKLATSLEQLEVWAKAEKYCLWICFFLCKAFNLGQKAALECEFCRQKLIFIIFQWLFLCCMQSYCILLYKLQWYSEW